MASLAAMKRLHRALIEAGVIKPMHKSLPSHHRQEYTYPSNIEVVIVEDVDTMNGIMDRAISLAKSCTHPQDPCVIGLDTEWAHGREVVLLQLSVGKMCILLRMHMLKEGCTSLGTPTSRPFSKIQDLFNMPNVIFVGSGIYECDLKKLFDQFEIDVDKMCWIDTQDAARCMVANGVFNQCKRPGLAGLTKKLFDVPLNKGEQCSEWDADQLSASQIKYAACDAVVSREIVEQMYMRAVLRDVTDVGFGEWLWGLQGDAKLVHDKRHHHHQHYRSSDQKNHDKGMAVVSKEDTPHPRRYTKALRLFATMDVNSSGILEKEELLKLAEWYWTRMHPGEIAGDESLETYEEMVEGIHKKYGAEFGLDDQIDLYREYSPKMYEANKAYRDNIKSASFN